MVCQCMQQLVSSSWKNTTSLFDFLSGKLSLEWIFFHRYIPREKERAMPKSILCEWRREIHERYTWWFHNSRQYGQLYESFSQKCTAIFFHALDFHFRHFFWFGCKLQLVINIKKGIQNGKAPVAFSLAFITHYIIT